MKKLLALALAAPLAATLSGCISFGAKPPPSLLTLTATAAIPVGQTQSSANSPTIVVQVPAVPAALAQTRVPVQSSPTDLSYIKNAQWAEPPARLFARLLADTITASTGRVVLGGAQSYADPGARLTGELRNFGVDATTNEAVVTYDGALLRSGGGAIEKRRFEARVPVSEIAPVPVSVAINQASNEVAAQVANWVGR